MAGRDNGYSAKVRRRLAVAGGESYRTAMREFAGRPLMEVWYARLDVEQAVKQFRSQIKAKRFKKTEALVAKAHTHDSMQVMDKLTTTVDGRRPDHQRPADDRAGRRGLRRYARPTRCTT